MKCIAIFASGKGSNAEKIIEHLKGHGSVKVKLIVASNPSAGVISIAHKNKIISAIVSKGFFGSEEKMTKLLTALQIDGIVLAGFMQLIPDFLIKQFPNRIINIHPALLPKFGGKGMYGLHVHRAVLAAGEKQSGITIHFVNERYDEGEVILQKQLSVATEETPETLQKKIQQLEHEYLPAVVAQIFG